MKAPDKTIAIIVNPNENEAHQRRLLEVEAFETVSGKELTEEMLLFSGRRGAPVEREPGKRDSMPDDLDRFFEILPDEVGAQYRVSIDDFLPRLRESPCIYFSVDSAGELNNIFTCKWAVQAMEE